MTTGSAHTDTAHAIFSASGTSRWFKCPASIRMSAAVPDKAESEYAADGTEAHTLLAWALENRYRDAQEALMMSCIEWTHRADDYIGRLGSVQTGLDYVYDILDTWGDDAILFVETRFTIPCEAAPNDAFGTADVVIVIPLLSLMYVVDLKNGAGVAVDADHNTQLMSYGIGVRSVLPYRVDSAVLVIVQPRAWHPKGDVREFATTDAELDAFVKLFNDKVIAALDPKAPFAPGVETCRFCAGKLACPAFEQAALDVVPMTDVTTWMDVEERKLPKIEGMPIEKIAYILQNKPMLMALLKAVENAGYAYAMSGKQLPGFKLVEPQARRKFVEPAEQTAKELMALIGTDDIDVVFPRTLIGITEAEALVKQAFRKEGVKPKQMDHAMQMAFAKLTIKDNVGGKFSLVPIGDARPASRARTVGAVFGNVKTIEGTLA